MSFGALSCEAPVSLGGISANWTKDCACAASCATSSYSFCICASSSLTFSNYQCARAQEHLQSLPSPISRSCPLRSHQGPCAFPDGAVSFRMTNCCAARSRRFSAVIGTATAGAAGGCPECSAESFAVACATASVEPSSPAALEGPAEASFGSSLPDSAEGPSAAVAADVTAELATSACGAAEAQ